MFHVEHNLPIGPPTHLTWGQLRNAPRNPTLVYSAQRYQYVASDFGHAPDR